MKFRGLSLALVLPLATMAGHVVASDYGTPEEARAMLESTVAMLQADKVGTLAMINAGEIMDRDLYPYCGGPDGMFTAHPNPDLLGRSLRELQDKEGTAFGETLYAEAAEGEIAEVSYMWPRPGETDPVQKVAYVTMVDDQVCAVGFYQE
ncbi:MAG: chemotaxis protein [Rhodospirillales bacterium]|nr:MAG: chemotaxis protein [Rhodospirillales bacterium]